MHEARHPAITEFLRDTGNLKLAQMLAGHADIGTTANIYAHLDTSDLEAATNEEPAVKSFLSEIRICGEDGGGGNRTRARFLSASARKRRPHEVRAN
jgi:hypothetical protein